MARSCHIIDHPADVGLEAQADSVEELFEALAEGLADIVCPRRTVAARRRRAIRVDSPDIEAAAVDFLSAVLKAMQVDHFMVAAVKVAAATANSVSAELSGEGYDPSRHEIAAEVKGVTYHQLKVARQDGEWYGRVIFDL